MTRTRALFSVLVLSTLTYACAGTKGTRSPSPENPYENIHTFVRYIKANQPKHKAWGAWSPIETKAFGTYSVEKITIGSGARMAAAQAYQGVPNRRRAKRAEEVRQFKQNVPALPSVSNLGLFVRRMEERVSQIENQIAEFCSHHRNGKLHYQEISDDENAPLYAREILSKEAMHSLESRYICVSQSGDTFTLQFLVDASFETQMKNGQRKSSINLHTIEPERERASADIENWEPTE